MIAFKTKDSSRTHKTDDVRVQISDICLNRNNKTILDNLHIDLSSRHFILMTGQNGSGKSTLLKILSGLVKADKLCISLPEHQKKSSYKQFLRKNFCYLHQMPYLFSGSVYDNIAYGLKYSGLAKTEIDHQVNEALKIVGLPQLSKRKSHALSGGEKQRIAIARSCIIKPNFILLDEPFANMDKHSRFSTYETINKLQDNNMGIIITSHDPHNGELAFNRHLHLYNGKMTENTI